MRACRLLFALFLFYTSTIFAQDFSAFAGVTNAQLAERANSGDGAAANALADRYDNGTNGATKDFAQSLRWYRRAAELGDKEGQFNFGYALRNGRGTDRDLKGALQAYTDAAQKGHPGAQKQLASMLENGEGTRVDLAGAARWYKAAADQSDKGALFSYGYALDKGRGVPMDKVSAIKYYRRSAELGYPVAMNNLGYAYEHGEGVPQDTEQAREWYGKAAAAGNEAAKKNLASLPVKQPQVATYNSAATTAAFEGEGNASSAPSPRAPVQMASAATSGENVQAAYQQRLAEYNLRVERLRQQADQAEQSAQEMEEKAQQLKSQTQQTANTGSGVLGALAIGLGSGAQFTSEREAQKARAQANRLRAQLREMGEQAPDPPALRNSINEGASESQNSIQEALDRNLNNINATAARVQQQKASAQQAAQQRAEQQRQQQQAAAVAQQQAAREQAQKRSQQVAVAAPPPAPTRSYTDKRCADMGNGEATCQYFAVTDGPNGHAEKWIRSVAVCPTTGVYFMPMRQNGDVAAANGYPCTPGQPLSDISMPVQQNPKPGVYPNPNSPANNNNGGGNSGNGTGSGSNPPGGATMNGFVPAQGNFFNGSNSNGWIAIATDNSTGQNYIAFNEPSDSKAHQDAMQGCGPTCSVRELTRTNTCGAIARDNTPGSSVNSWMYGDNLNTIQQSVITSCMSNGGGACYVQTFACAGLKYLQR